MREESFVVNINPPGIESHKRLWVLHELASFLNHLTYKDGLTLTIHASDGTKVEVYPKCLHCGCYNTIDPLIDKLCRHCYDRGLGDG